MNKRAEYSRRYYREHKAEMAAKKAWLQKHDLDYRLRSILRTIIQRCNDPRHASYRWYGGKGIKNHLTLDDLKLMWRRDRADKMRKPSIDRQSANDDYALSNCCFRELRENQQRGWAANRETHSAAIGEVVRERYRRMKAPHAISQQA